MATGKSDIPTLPKDDDDDGRPEKTVLHEELRFMLGIGHKPWLLVVDGRRCVGMLIEVRNKMTLGRTPPADVVIDEERVSRRHALIEVLHGGVVRITDLGSTHGVRVGGRRVKYHAMRDGERVRLGDAVLTLVHVEDNRQLFEKNLRASLDLLSKQTSQSSAP